MNSKSGLLVASAIAVFGLMASTMTSAADAAPAAAPAKVPTSNKWRVEFDGKAETDGQIVFNMNVDGTITTITTAVKKGTSENTIAKEVVKALKQQAPPKKFHFETDDGEAVYFKKKVGMGVPDFGVELVNNSVAGIGIKVKKD